MKAQERATISEESEKVILMTVAGKVKRGDIKETLVELGCAKPT